jgi:hypothetical protein
MPSTGPDLPQKVPHTMRTWVPSSSVTLRDVAGLYLLITRRSHLLRRRQVGPELEAVHAAGGISLGHLLVNDATAGCHPLHVARCDSAVVAHAVAVLNGSGEYIGDGLDTAVRVPGKSGEVVFGDIVSEIVQEQEGIEVVGVAEAEGAAEMHSRTFEGRLGLDKALNGSNGHGCLRVAKSAIGMQYDELTSGCTDLMRERCRGTQTAATSTLYALEESAKPRGGYDAADNRMFATSAGRST